MLTWSKGARRSLISRALAGPVTPSCGVVDSVGAIGCGLFAGITLLRLLRRGAADRCAIFASCKLLCLPVYSELYSLVCSCVRPPNAAGVKMYSGRRHSYLAILVAAVLVASTLVVGGSGAADASAAERATTSSKLAAAVIVPGIASHAVTQPKPESTGRLGSLAAR